MQLHLGGNRSCAHLISSLVVIQDTTNIFMGPQWPLPLLCVCVETKVQGLCRVG